MYPYPPPSSRLVGIIYDDAPSPFSRSDGFSFLSINVGSVLVSCSSVGDCSSSTIASLSASFTGIAPSPPFSPFLPLTICRRSVYDCIGKAMREVLGPRHKVNTYSHEQRTKEQSDERDRGEDNPVVHIRAVPKPSMSPDEPYQRNRACVSMEHFVPKNLWLCEWLETWLDQSLNRAPGYQLIPEDHWSSQTRCSVHILR